MAHLCGTSGDVCHPCPRVRRGTDPKFSCPSASLGRLDTEARARDGGGDTVRTLSAVATVTQWPVTFFLPTRYLDTSDAMPFQWFERVLAVMPWARLTLPLGDVALSTNAERRAWERGMVRLLYTRP